jgi:hypothetical protein
MEAGKKTAIEEELIDVNNDNLIVSMDVAKMPITEEELTDGNN